MPRIRTDKRLKVLEKAYRVPEKSSVDLDALSTDQLRELASLLRRCPPDLPPQDRVKVFESLTAERAAYFNQMWEALLNAGQP